MHHVHYNQVTRRTTTARYYEIDDYGNLICTEHDLCCCCASSDSESDNWGRRDREPKKTVHCYDFPEY